MMEIGYDQKDAVKTAARKRRFEDRQPDRPDRQGPHRGGTVMTGRRKGHRSAEERIWKKYCKGIVFIVSGSFTLHHSRWWVSLFWLKGAANLGVPSWAQPFCLLPLAVGLGSRMMKGNAKEKQKREGKHKIGMPCAARIWHN